MDALGEGFTVAIGAVRILGKIVGFSGFAGVRHDHAGTVTSAASTSSTGTRSASRAC
jgi:hypothetical protein